jgi:hypothetical protein
MRADSIAVADDSIVGRPVDLKRAALLCDQVVVIGLGTALWRAERASGAGAPSVNVAEIEWLRERGVVADPPPELGAVVRASIEIAARRAVALDPDVGADDAIAPRVSRLEAGVMELLGQFEHVPAEDVGLLWPRMFAAELRREHGRDAVSIGTGRLPGPERRVVTRDAVAHVVIESLPHPADTTPWEAILDFRSDPATGALLRRLRRWMNAFVTTRAGVAQSEAVDELRYLLDEYEAYMRLHRMKAVNGTLETLVVTTAEVLESVVKLKWSAAAKSLFALKRRQVELLEAERGAPGRDLAYILRARDAFSR